VLFFESAAMNGRFLTFAIRDDRTHTAAAPLTISEISWVIAAWRALL
jgi:hypothetical protein